MVQVIFFLATIVVGVFLLNISFTTENKFLEAMINGIISLPIFRNFVARNEKNISLITILGHGFIVAIILFGIKMIFNLLF